MSRDSVIDKSLRFGAASDSIKKLFGDSVALDGEGAARDLAKQPANMKPKLLRDPEKSLCLLSQENAGGHDSKGKVQTRNFPGLHFIFSDCFS